jgi:hypothetical protein
VKEIEEVPASFTNKNHNTRATSGYTGLRNTVLFSKGL